MPTIPVTSMSLELSDAAVSAALATIASQTSPGLVRAQKSARFGSQAVTALAATATPLALTVTVAGPCRIRVEAHGVIGHNLPGGTVWLTLNRNAVPRDGGAALAVARAPSPLDVIPFSLDYTDAITEAGDYTFEIAARQSSSHAGATGWIGRRGQDAAIAQQTVMTVTVMDPEPA